MKVALNPAYSWDCDNCGKENFQRSISMYLDPNDEDDASVIERMHGEVDPGRKYCVQTSPDNVTCQYCGRTFEADIDCGEPMDDEPEEEGDSE